MNLTPRQDTLILLTVLVILLIAACWAQNRRQSQDPVLRKAAEQPPKRMRVVEDSSTPNYRIWEDTETGVKYLQTSVGITPLKENSQ